MKNVELTYSERNQIIAALEREREEIEKKIKFWSDRADSDVEKKIKYESFAQHCSERLEKVNRIIEKLSVE